MSGATVTCEQVGGTVQGSDCVQGDSSGTPDEISDMGTYTASGGVFTTYAQDDNSFDAGLPDVDGGVSEDSQEYCVRGDTLHVRFGDNSSDVVFEYTGTRQ